MLAAAPPPVPVPGLPLARRTGELGDETAFSVARRVAELRRAGRDIADLSIGEPDLPTPQFIVDAGCRALRSGATRYGPPAGLTALRAAIAARAGASVAAESVFVTPGAKPAILYALLASVDPGDEVLVPDPGFVPYLAQVRIAGGVPVPYPLDAAAGFVPSAGAIAERLSARTRAIIVNAPGNPSGGPLSGPVRDEIAALAARHGILLIADEIYARLAPGSARFPAPAIVVSALSKSHRMTGWRLGWAVVPPRYREAFERLAVNGHSCVPTFVQAAAVEALELGADVVAEFARELSRRRQHAVRALARVPGLRCDAPAGTFYAFPDCSGLLRRLRADDTTLARRLLEEAGVATIAGSSFGDGGRDHLRLSLGAAPDVLEAGIARIHRFARDIHPD